MGRPAIGRQTTFRLDDETRERIENVLGDGEKFAAFIRSAVLEELERREAVARKPKRR